ncbi:uncharacterized protein LOC142528131 isoform X2 [Primulina tabacum]|uniref:uncharacterized protein LOC142528131 isoform X1 n=1 Tax=Primulina tabacum TaxID=48773 RepID=UPI003F59249F
MVLRCLEHQERIGLQPFRNRMRFKVSIVNLLNEEDPAIDHLFEENIAAHEGEQVGGQENIATHEGEQVGGQENIATHEGEQVGGQENIPNYEGQQQRVGSSGLGQRQRAGSSGLGQQRRDGSSGLRGNMDEIKKNIARKELKIKAEKEKLRIMDSGLFTFSSVTVLLNLLSSHVPLEQNPLHLESSLDKTMMKKLQELFGKTVPTIDEFLRPSYKVIEPVMQRLAPGYSFKVNDVGPYFVAVGEHEENLIPLKNMLGELEELKSQKEELERKLQEQGI